MKERIMKERPASEVEAGMSRRLRSAAQCSGFAPLRRFEINCSGVCSGKEAQEA
jgi:hypothetical protein